MGESLDKIFAAVSAPPCDNEERPVFAVLPVPGFEGCFVGKDGEGRACLLIATADAGTRPPPPIRLESLDAQFALRCHLKKPQLWIGDVCHFRLSCLELIGSQA